MSVRSSVLISFTISVAMNVACAVWRDVTNVVSSRDAEQLNFKPQTNPRYTMTVMRNGSVYRIDVISNNVVF